MASTLSLRALLTSLALASCAAAQQPVNKPRVLTASYTGTPLREAFADLAARWQVEIHPLWTGPAQSGLDPDLPVTVTLRAATVERCIEQLVREADGDTTWQQDEDGAYEVGPRARLDAHPVLRLYDAHDLLASVPDYTDGATLDLAAALSGERGASVLHENDREERLPDRAARADDLRALIMASIEPERWLDAGGGSTISTHGGVLIVRAPGYIQRQLVAHPRP
jgi:hypothetical protein